MANNTKNITEQLNTAVKHVGESVENAAHALGDFFQGNPFETEVGKKIELATDADHLSTENWGKFNESHKFKHSFQSSVFGVLT